jgi:hypothetical protein
VTLLEHGTPAVDTAAMRAGAEESAVRAERARSTVRAMQERLAARIERLERSRRRVAAYRDDAGAEASRRGTRAVAEDRVRRT